MDLNTNSDLNSDSLVLFMNRVLEFGSTKIKNILESIQKILPDKLQYALSYIFNKTSAYLYHFQHVTTCYHKDFRKTIFYGILTYSDINGRD